MYKRQDPIPNSEVKRRCADGSVGLPHVRVGHRQVLNVNPVSYTHLMYKPPLGKVSQKRLQVLRDSQDGFVISEKDLEIRGPGEVLSLIHI